MNEQAQHLRSSTAGTDRRSDRRLALYQQREATLIDPHDHGRRPHVVAVSRAPSPPTSRVSQPGTPAPNSSQRSATRPRRCSAWQAPTTPAQRSTVADQLTLTATPTGSAETVVIDSQRLDQLDTQPDGLLLVVLRGPCYLGLAHDHDERRAGASGRTSCCSREPGRSLTRRDVSDVCDVPVMAEIAVTATRGPHDRRRTPRHAASDQAPRAQSSSAATSRLILAARQRSSGTRHGRLTRAPVSPKNGLHDRYRLARSAKRNGPSSWRKRSPHVLLGTGQ